MEALTKQQTVSPELVSNLVLNGDLSKMNDVQKVEYYNWLCHSLNLNPATKPFQLISFQGKQILYATKDATEQLRKINKVSVMDSTTEIMEGLCITKVKVQDADGRYDIATGIVNIGGLQPEAKANAIMKAETKAKRRATLSICGLGMLDESELDTMPKYETSDITATKNIKPDNERDSKAREYVELLEKATTHLELEGIVNNIPDEFKTEKFNEYIDTLITKIPAVETTGIEEAEVVEELSAYDEMKNRINSCNSETDLSEIQKELKDSFYFMGNDLKQLNKMIAIRSAELKK